MIQDKNPIPTPQQEEPDKQSQRNQQAEEIMQQLVAEGIFTENEIVEIQFSDTTFVGIPNKNGQV